MTYQNQDFIKELLSMFKIEAEEHIKEMSSGLLKLEKEPNGEGRKTILETVYREAHSLKGAARTVNLIPIETLCQALESVFSLIKHEKLHTSEDVFDVLHQGVDRLNDLLEKSENTEISEIVRQLAKLEKNKVTATDNFNEEQKDVSITKENNDQFQESDKYESVIAENSDDEKEISMGKASHAPEPKISESSVMKSIQSVQEKTLVADTVRVSTEKLDSIMLQAEEMLSAKLASHQQAAELKHLLNTVDSWKKDWERSLPEFRTLRRALEKDLENDEDGFQILQMLKLLDYLDQSQERLKKIESLIQPLTKVSDHNYRFMGALIDQILEDMKTVLMLPFSTLMKILPKVVRDLSRDQGKEIELVIRGSTTEVDRRILEEMKDPFVHILRNSIDHGIEKPDIRIKNKKSREGTITVSISQKSGNTLEIIISDNGCGIDTDQVARIAVDRGIITKSDAGKLSEKEKLLLIFQSDVSTSPIITDISGRGLGLAIVREKVEKLGGMIAIETKPGEGTTFKMTIPVTMSTFRGIVVNELGHLFVVPTIHVERVMRIQSDSVRTVENKEIITINEESIAFVRLRDVLELNNENSADNDTSAIQIMILSSGKHRIAFGVDEILNEQEVLVKGLGRQLSRVRNVAGSTIFGSGKVVPILNISDLVKSAVHISPVGLKRLHKEEGNSVKKAILIAEDSITSRTLLKNILETAGYEVFTAVDGADAFSALKDREFDLVVSDVEMPRMSGFELVSKIRQSSKTSELPVVLVTGLESRDDRERGIEVGANAYIVKRSFDQSNLLEVVQRLI